MHLHHPVLLSLGLRLFRSAYYFEAFYDNVYVIILTSKPGLKNGSLECYHYTNGAGNKKARAFVLVCFSHDTQMRIFRDINNLQTSLPARAKDQVFY